MKGKTTLIISHRISAVKDAGHIIMLKDGRIAEQGTHSELVAKGGLYNLMMESQIIENE
jgi:hypothetical protein